MRRCTFISCQRATSMVLNRIFARHYGGGDGSSLTLLSCTNPIQIYGACTVLSICISFNTPFYIYIMLNVTLVRNKSHVQSNIRHGLWWRWWKGLIIQNHTRCIKVVSSNHVGYFLCDLLSPVRDGWSVKSRRVMLTLFHSVVSHRVMLWGHPIDIITLSGISHGDVVRMSYRHHYTQW